MQLLADPVRVRLIFALRDGELCVSELVDRVDRDRRVVSHHLAELRRDGVLERRKEATNVFYRLADFSVCKVLLLAGEGVAARIEELGDIASEHPTQQWFT